MARSYETIKAEIQTEIRTYPSLNDYLFPEEGGSKVSIFNVIISTVALAIFTMESLIDGAKTELTNISEGIPSGNAKWVQRQMLNFQYGDVITFVDNVPSYNPVDEGARIITRCSVKTDTNGGLLIKVAKGVGTLSPLSGAELTALLDYYYGTPTSEGVGFAGVRASFVNTQADRIRVQATVYFFGQFAEATVKTAVIAAINDFLATFSDTAFDGTIFMSRLVDAVQAVDGVSRVNLTSVKARDFSTPLAGASTVDPQGTYATVAGYVVSEDTASNTLTDTITMTQEPIT